MLATPKFGAPCPVCKRFCMIGYVEIDETTCVREWCSELLREGWPGEEARCDDPKCEGPDLLRLDLVVFERDDSLLRRVCGNSHDSG
jgi:hypothetical protein